MEILKADLKLPALRPRYRTDYIILHHAAGSGSVEAVNAYHKSIGWSGIGYNYYVRRDGSVWEGRGLDKVGAHAGGAYNERSCGICAEGNFEREVMTPAQKQGLTELLAYVWKHYPNATVAGHRDVTATACPGMNYPIDDIREGAKRLMGGGSPETPKPPSAPAPTPSAPAGGAFIALPILRRGSRGETVKALQTLLALRGHKPGRWGADGSFGGATEKSLREYQSASGLTADGICGINTWKSLLGV